MLVLNSADLKTGCKENSEHCANIHLPNYWIDGGLI